MLLTQFPMYNHTNTTNNTNAYKSHIFSSFICPCSSTLVLGHGGSRLSKEVQMFVFPATLFGSSWRIPRGSLARWDIKCLQHVLVLHLYLLPVGHAQKTSRGRCPGGFPSHLNWLWREGAVVLLRVFSGRLECSWEEFSTLCRKFISAPCICTVIFFSLYPKLMPIGEGWNKAQLVNWKLCLSAQLPLHHNNQIHEHKASITADTSPIHLLISKWTLPSLVNKTPRYFNSLTCGWNSLPTPRGQPVFSGKK